MRAVADDVGKAVLDRASDRLHGLQLGVDDSFVPVIEVRCRGRTVGVVPKITKHLLVGPSLARFKWV